MFAYVRSFFLVLSILFSLSGCEKKDRDSVAVNETNFSQITRSDDNCFYVWKRDNDESELRLRYVCIEGAIVHEYVTQSEGSGLCSHAFLND